MSAADRPLVSIIIPTWQRHNLVMDTLANIREQTYADLEVILVSDGLDPELRHRLWSSGHRPADVFTDGGPLRLQFVECGRNWTGLVPNSFAVAPLMVGALLARGPLMLWLADDERMTPDHVEHLVDLIETTGVDFVYPQVMLFNAHAPEVQWMIGADPPVFGQITSILFRAERCFALAPFKFHIPSDQYPPVHDWDFVRRLVEAGATWRMSDRCTLTHRADHLGSDESRLEGLGLVAVGG